MKDKLIEARLSPKRTLFILLIGVLYFAGTAYLTERKELSADEAGAILVIAVVFYGALVIALYQKRLHGVLYNGTGYMMVFLTIAAAWAVALMADSGDAYFYPVMVIPFLLATSADGVIAVSVSVFLCLMLALTGTGSVYLLYCRLTECVIGGLLASVRRAQPKSYRIVITALATVFTVFCGYVFYYFTFLEIPEISERQLAFTIGAVIAAALVLFEPINSLSVHERRTAYERLLDDEYALLQDMKGFSGAEYRHAKRVSWLAGICAEEIGADRLTAMAGGMYYRLGKLYGEPQISNAVRSAYRHSFPPEVISIIEEYEAIERRPTTRESAIVHMVDALITRTEAFGHDVTGSEWNQDMVVYQTLNECSQQGIYDDSGLGMNQFLKIRDRLLREDIS